MKSKIIKHVHNSEEYQQAWDILVNEPKWKRKTQAALQMCANKLGRVSERSAIEAMEDAIAGGWQGIFPKEESFIKQNIDVFIQLSKKYEHESNNEK